ncbi:MAG: MarR family transcriptional regulator [Deltaproteobacteria bacterium]|nr:MarR family transcriptional regulator [Deltaproteobacteria bacterium]
MVDDFRALLQEFIRRFGLLADHRTPCGKPMPTSDAHALMCLRAAGDDGLPHTAIAARLALDKSTVSRVMARLAEAGHVAVAEGDDARTRPVRLTRKGLRVADDVDQRSQRRFAALLEGVPPARRDPVIRALRDLVAAMGALDRIEEED